MDIFQLAEQGFDVSHLVTWENVNDKSPRGNTLLHTACRNEDEALALLLIDMGAFIDARDRSDETPLFCAAGHGTLVHLLLQRGANPSLANKHGDLPVDEAAVCVFEDDEDADAIEALIALVLAYPEGAGRKGDGFAPLHALACTDLLECCRLILDAGCNVDAQMWSGETPLRLALSKGRVQVATLLMYYGAQLCNVVLDPKNSEEDGDEYEEEEEEAEEEKLTEIPFWALDIAKCRKNCLSVCWAMLQLRRRKSNALLGQNGRDVLRLVARLVWQTRQDEAWLRQHKLSRFFCGKTDL